MNNQFDSDKNFDSDKEFNFMLKNLRQAKSIVLPDLDFLEESYLLPDLDDLNNIFTNKDWWS